MELFKEVGCPHLKLAMICILYEDDRKSWDRKLNFTDDSSSIELKLELERSLNLNVIVLFQI